MSDGKDLPMLLTVAEVAALLRTTPDAIYARVERGRLTAGLFRDGRKILFRRDALLAWIEGKVATARYPDEPLRERARPKR